MLNILKPLINATSDARVGRIRSAIYTSLLSKGSTILLQLLAMPLVARCLGADLFGLYSALSALPAMMSNLDMGVGPALSQRLARGEALGDRDDQARTFQACALFIIVISVLVVIIGSLLVKSDLIIGFYATTFPGQRNAITKSCWAIVILVALQLVSSLGQKARAGFQEIHVNNLYGAAGNVLLCACLAVSVHYSENIPTLISIVYGCAILAGIANLCDLMVARSYLIKKFAKPRLQVVSALVRDSFWFACALSLLTWQREAAKLVLLRINADYASRYSIMLSLLYASGGFIIMFTGALWPAIADARARNDNNWLESLKRKITKISIIISLLGFVSLLCMGQKMIQFLYGKQFCIGTIEILALGIYFGLQVIGHIRFTWIMGCGAMRFLFSIALLEFSINCLLTFVLFRFLNPALMLSILLSSHFIASILIQSRSKYWKSS